MSDTPVLDETPQGDPAAETPPAAPAATPAAMPPVIPAPPAAPAAPADDPEDEDDDDVTPSVRQDRALRKARNEARNLRQREKDALARAEAAEARVLAAELGALCAVNGITDPADIAIVQASGTPEAMKATAERLGVHLKAGQAPAPQAPPSDRPMEGLTPGASPTPPAQPDNSYPASWGFLPSREN